MSDEEIIEELTYKLDMTEHQYFELMDKYNKEKSRVMELAELLDKQESEIKSLEEEIELGNGITKAQFISKDKIRDKIKKLEEQAEKVKEHYRGTYACLDEYLNAKSKIQGYKELLEEE